ncbi:M48 family metallopeptidase [Ramlibacter algicola]|uniref:M48 family metallopeptidase n=1 Tax=Ramlibacter algicola TaxID=2795217 RepID=A0A934URG6_9BURK|nr:M48 family metallopeptidase [Ramlibacter algicola]MBK0392512.1 M48 family metallopeptidase [Ramlibacter algicola]
MLSPYAWTLAFAAMLVASLALRFWLASRQIRHVARHRGDVPAAFASTVSLAAHQKAADYTITKSRLGLIEMAFGGVVLLGWTLLGGLHALNQALLAWLGPGMAQQLALLVAFTAIGGLLDLPFSLYSTFVIEERFGFNRMTWRLWLLDAIKGLLLAAVLMLPLAWAVLWIMGAAGRLWWLYAWALVALFQVFVLWIAPVVIMPLFNKFSPLQDAGLRERIVALMQRCGYTARELFVMDGSKRSAHANAYFAGFGRNKRVVFFDTLLNKLSPAEIDAVLAHEIGHFRHRHIVKRIGAVFAVSLLGFGLLGWLQSQPWFYLGLGVGPNLEGPNDALALVLFLLVVPVFSFFVGPLMAQLSRGHEFEADAFAVAQTGRDDLKSALLKLYEDNASTLTPDPLFVKFYYSHPPASERLARMAAA